MATEEFLQIVDADTGEPTGELAARSVVIRDKLWCRGTNIYVLNPQGQVLCHQRSFDKERHPGVWVTHFGGHVTEGESFKINALKELEEETGIHIGALQLIPWRTSRKDNERFWFRDFLTVYDGPAEALQIQESEIEQVRWFSFEEIIDSFNGEAYIEGKAWLLGTHDFYADYQCMRAVLTATLDAGIFGTNYHALHKWQPMRKIA